jgi:hypothetical protein
MKIAMCPLVSRDLYRAIRATNSCRNQFKTKSINFETVPIINSQNQEFIENFTKWCEKEEIKFKITESNGTPSKGKNSVLEFLLESDFDGVSLTDGDDLFYPTGALQIERHLIHHSNTDVLIVKPSDQVSNNKVENSTEIKNNQYAILWGTNNIKMNYKYGPGEHDIFTKGHYASGNIGGHVFYSKKLANLVKYDEQQLLGEDLLLEFELLKLHQKGDISFWLSFASDVQMLDRTDHNGIQMIKNKTEGIIYFNRLLEKVQKILCKERSSFDELPVEFPPMLFNYEQKINWLKEFF